MKRLAVLTCLLVTTLVSSCTAQEELTRLEGRVKELEAKAAMADEMARELEARGAKIDQLTSQLESMSKRLTQGETDTSANRDTLVRLSTLAPDLANLKASIDVVEVKVNNVMAGLADGTRSLNVASVTTQAIEVVLKNGEPIFQAISHPSGEAIRSAVSIFPSSEYESGIAFRPIIGSFGPSVELKNRDSVMTLTAFERSGLGPRIRHERDNDSFWTTPSWFLEVGLKQRLQRQ